MKSVHKRNASRVFCACLVELSFFFLNKSSAMKSRKTAGWVVGRRICLYSLLSVKLCFFFFKINWT